MENRETPRMCKYGESKTTRIMMATVRHVTSRSEPRKFQAAWFLLNRGYIVGPPWPMVHPFRGVYDGLNLDHIFLILVSFILYRKIYPCFSLLNLPQIATRSASPLHVRVIGSYIEQSESVIPRWDVKVMAIQYTTCARWITASTGLYVCFPWVETG